MTKTTSILCAAALMAAASSFSAQAADLGGNCCADLEERIAELEATTVRKGNRKVSLTLSGQVSQSLMCWDDGAEANTYQVVSNFGNPSYFAFAGEADDRPGLDGRLQHALWYVDQVFSGNIGQLSDDGAVAWRRLLLLAQLLVDQEREATARSRSASPRGRPIWLRSRISRARSTTRRTRS